MNCTSCKDTVSSKASCTQVISADCVIYQGDSIPLLGICCGDSISDVEEKLIDKLLTVIDGTGILLSGVTLANAPFLLNLLGTKDKTLLNMIQLLVDSDTNLRALVASLQAQLSPTGDNFQFDLGCLASDCCPNNPVSRDDIIQLLIDKYCDIETLLDQITQTGTNISNSVVSSIGNYLSTNIKTQNGQGLTVTGTGATTVLTFNRTPPKAIALPYWGPLSNFGPSGAGLLGTDAYGWHWLNGQDGYPDWRGYTFASATQGLGNTALDPRVDANALNLQSLVSNYSDKKGELAHTITLAEMTQHTHVLIDPGHDHPQFYHPFTRSLKSNGNDDVVFEDTDNTYNRTNLTTPGKPFIGFNTTGITMQSSGNSQPHNNVQPTVFGVWIAPMF